MYFCYGCARRRQRIAMRTMRRASKAAYARTRTEQLSMRMASKAAYASTLTEQPQNSYENGI